LDECGYDAAKQTKVSKRTLQRWIHDGLLRPYRVRGDARTYVDLDQIAKLREPRPRDEPKP
jgi:excisionase family DNA binding protein